mmetsp:Transcript_4255/g.12245  ORF Transcript_4255/g.12245 Transcript_4255/m.12245 type:complete len:221 (+) Transcript_4255:1863-2525(+)
MDTVRPSRPPPSAIVPPELTVFVLLSRARTIGDWTAKVEDEGTISRSTRIRYPSSIPKTDSSRKEFFRPTSYCSPTIFVPAPNMEDTSISSSTLVVSRLSIEHPVSGSTVIVFRCIVCPSLSSLTRISKHFGSCPHSSKASGTRCCGTGMKEPSPGLKVAARPAKSPPMGCPTEVEVAACTKFSKSCGNMDKCVGCHDDRRWKGLDTENARAEWLNAHSR